MSKPVILPGDDDPRVVMFDKLLDNVLAGTSRAGGSTKEMLDAIDLAKSIGMIIRKTALGYIDAGLPPDRLIASLALMIIMAFEASPAAIDALKSNLEYQIAAFVKDAKKRGRSQ